LGNLLSVLFLPAPASLRPFPAGAGFMLAEGICNACTHPAKRAGFFCQVSPVVQQHNRWLHRACSTEYGGPSFYRYHLVGRRIA
jgi:hypothetical protein